MRKRVLHGAAVVAAAALVLLALPAAAPRLHADTGRFARTEYGYRLAPQSSPPPNCTNPDRQCIWTKATDGRTYLHNIDGSDAVLTTGAPSTGNWTFAGAAPAAATATTAQAEARVEQTGDTFGATRVRLVNRSGANGAIFENAGVALVDFIFAELVGNTTRDMRYEARTGVTLDGSPEFQFGPVGAPSTVIGDSGIYVQPGKRIKAPHYVGTGPTPTIAVGSVAQLGTSPSASVYGTDAYHVVTITTGTSPAAFPAGTPVIVGTITFGGSYGTTAPVVVIVDEANAAAAALKTGSAGINFYAEQSSIGSTQWVLRAVTLGTPTLAAQTPYKLFVTVGG